MLGYAVKIQSRLVLRASPEVLTENMDASEGLRQDLAAHRRNHNYPTSVYIKRVIWGALKPIFRLSPRKLYGFRNWLLRLMGAKLGERVIIYPQAEVFFPWNLVIGDDSIISWDVKIYNLGPIEIGRHTMISQGVQLCAGTHDFRQPNLPLLTPPIKVGSGVWLCAGAFIGPGVSIADNAVVGARAIVVKNVENGDIVAGNPARVIGKR